MNINLTKKEVVSKVDFFVNLENEKEIQAFKNILSMAESEIYTALRDNRYKVEKEIIEKLKKLL